MKKRISAAMLAAIITLTLAGCSNNTNSSNSADSTSSSASDVSSATSEGTSAATDDSSATADTNAATGDVVTGDAGTAENNDGGIDNSGLEYPDTKAGNMVKAALSTDAWGAMALMTTQDEVNAIFGEDSLVLENLEDYCISYNLMSAQLLWVIAVKPVAGSEEAVQTALDNFLAVQKENGAFYPSQEESVAGAVSGTTDDGYMYLVIHKNGQAVADAMVAAE